MCRVTCASVAPSSRAASTVPGSTPDRAAPNNSTFSATSLPAVITSMTHSAVAGLPSRFGAGRPATANRLCTRPCKGLRANCQDTAVATGASTIGTNSRQR